MRKINKRAKKSECFSKPGVFVNKFINLMIANICTIVEIPGETGITINSFFFFHWIMVK